MVMAGRRTRRNHEARTRIWVAVIGAAAAVIAALVTAIVQYKTPNTGATPGDTVIAPGSQNVAVNTPGTVIQNSPGASVGKKTAFQKQNSMIVHSIDGFTSGGRTSMMLGTRNYSDRFIGDAEIAAYALTSELPILMGKSQRFGLGSGQIQPISSLTFLGEAPERLRLCLSFPSSDPGSFLTVLMDVHRENIGKYHFKYAMSSDYDVYFSTRQSDCDKRFFSKSVPSADYTGVIG
jgi:hypothetical protein